MVGGSARGGGGGGGAAAQSSSLARCASWLYKGLGLGFGVRTHPASRWRAARPGCTQS